MHIKIKNDLEKAECMANKALGIAESGRYEVDCDQMYLLADVIKDFSQSVKDLSEAYYYQTIVNAMEEAKLEEDNGIMMGYDNWHYANGRFAPKGHGHNIRRGYSPNIDKKFPEIYDPMDIHDMNDGMDGYPVSHMRNHSGNNSDKRMSSRGAMMGYSYDKWDAARKNYNETMAVDDKKEMDANATRHVHEAVKSILEIWNDADPDIKKELKEELTPLIKESSK